MSVFKIHHITKYIYRQPVKESINQIKIYPIVSTYTDILSHVIQISDNPELAVYKDYWGNQVGVFSIVKPHCELIIDNKITITTQSHPLDYDKSRNIDWKSLPEIYKNEILFCDLLKNEDIDNIVHIDNILHNTFSTEISPLEFILNCNSYIFENFTYTKGITTIETTVDEILKLKSGVCQDFAHLLLFLLRKMGIPSRYVSGYICPNKNGMRGEGATHAWVEAYLPHLGWVGIDPTNNCIVDNQHIKLATGRHFHDCTPVKGTFRGMSIQELYVYVSVGYEDGTIFEDESTVMLVKEPVINNVDVLLPKYDQQQQ